MKDSSSARRLLNEGAAAAYRGIAPGTQRNERHKDRQRIASGEDPLGPTWVTVRGKPYYPIDELDRWLERNAVPFGEPATRGPRSRLRGAA
jgi:hypothetical protein